MLQALDELQASLKIQREEQKLSVYAMIMMSFQQVIAD
jgi:hypothetical protein